jgi:DNA-binding response OmpR family regulator
VALLDLHLPDGHGLGLIERLKAEPMMVLVPIFVWSGSYDEHDVPDVMRAGAAAYFDKRDIKDLVSRIVGSFVARMSDERAPR